MMNNRSSSWAWVPLFLECSPPTPTPMKYLKVSHFGKDVPACAALLAHPPRLQDLAPGPQLTHSLPEKPPHRQAGAHDRPSPRPAGLSYDPSECCGPLPRAFYDEKKPKRRMQSWWGCWWKLQRHFPFFIWFFLPWLINSLAVHPRTYWLRSLSLLVKRTWVEPSQHSPGGTQVWFKAESNSLGGMHGNVAGGSPLLVELAWTLSPPGQLSGSLLPPPSCPPSPSSFLHDLHPVSFSFCSFFFLLFFLSFIYCQKRSSLQSLVRKLTQTSVCQEGTV